MCKAGSKLTGWEPTTVTPTRDDSTETGGRGGHNPLHGLQRGLSNCIVEMLG